MSILDKIKAWIEDARDDALLIALGDAEHDRDVLKQANLRRKLGMSGLVLHGPRRPR